LTNPTEQQHKIEQAPAPVESGMKMPRGDDPEWESMKLCLHIHEGTPDDLAQRPSPVRPDEL
jgi:hypothetical protein